MTSLRAIIFAVLTGIVLGFVGTAFYYGMQTVTAMRLDHPWLILFLPLAGVLIVWLYHLLHDEKDTGTNLVLSAIHSNENIPLVTLRLNLSGKQTIIAIIITDSGE